MLAIANTRERLLGTGLGVCAGGLFAFGFLGVAQALGEALVVRTPLDELSGNWILALSAPALAWAFHLSVRPRGPLGRETRPWLSLLPACAIAYAFGFFSPGRGEVWITGLPQRALILSYTLVWAPIAEELLFRGWLYSVVDRLVPKLASATNPLPVAIWASALAFSVWHIQNWGSYPHGLVAFQIAYTLPLGLWLGWLRWRTGTLWAPLIAHCGVNLSTALG